MQANDGLPELMCVPCVLQVSRAFTFKQQCRRSDQTLRAFLNDVGQLTISGNNDIEDDTIILDTNNVIQSKAENISAFVASVDKVDDHSFSHPSDGSETDNLDSELVLDELSAEIETSSFEEEIELTSLPSETQFSPVKDIVHLNDVQEMKKENLPSKFGDYFNEIKLDVVQVVSLADEAFGMVSFSIVSSNKY